jgi:hypothetical protein
MRRPTTRPCHSTKREKRKKETEGKLVKVNNAKQSLEQFERTATSNLEEKQRIAKEKILADILNVITNQAKAGGYTQVIDAAAEGLSKTRILLYDSGQHDLTEAILKELNANAPANLPATSTDKKERRSKGQPVLIRSSRAILISPISTFAPPLGQRDGGFPQRLPFSPLSPGSPCNRRP